MAPQPTRATRTGAIDAAECWLDTDVLSRISVSRRDPIDAQDVGKLIETPRVQLRQQFELPAWNLRQRRPGVRSGNEKKLADRECRHLRSHEKRAPEVLRQIVRNRLGVVTQYGLPELSAGHHDVGRPTIVVPRSILIVAE